MPRLLRDWLALFNRLDGRDTGDAQLATVRRPRGETDRSRSAARRGGADGAARTRGRTGSAWSSTRVRR